MSSIETMKGLDAAWRRKIVCIAAMYAVLFLVFAMNRLLMTDFIYPASMCDGRLLAIVVTILVFRYCADFAVPMDNAADADGKREKSIYFWGVFALCIVVLGTYYAAYFPGCYIGDCKGQLKQALTGKYYDWHPAIQTLLAYTLPLKLFHCVESIVPFQILCFSLSFAYLVWSMRKVQCPQILCILTVAFVLLSPVTGDIFCRPYKDSSLAVFAALAVAFYIQIVHSSGAWLDSKAHIALFAVSMALTTMMRHNAILFTLPLAVSAVVYACKLRKAAVVSIALSVVVMAGIKVPLYRALHVAHVKTPVVELTGLCMSIMGNAIVSTPELLPKEVADFLYEVAPKGAWEKYYKLRPGYNSIKGEHITDSTVIEKAGIKKVIKYTLMTRSACKEATLQAFVWRTRFFWQIDGECTFYILGDPTPEFSKIQLNKTLTKVLRKLLYAQKSIARHTLLVYPLYFFLGWMNLLLIVFAIINVYRGKNILLLLHAIPILCHNAGTTLLLTGNEFRYFYFTFPVAIPMLFIFLRQEIEGGNQ